MICPPLYSLLRQDAGQWCCRFQLVGLHALLPSHPMGAVRCIPRSGCDAAPEQESGRWEGFFIRLSEKRDVLGLLIGTVLRPWHFCLWHSSLGHWVPRASCCKQSLRAGLGPFRLLVSCCQFCELKIWPAIATTDPKPWFGSNVLTGIRKERASSFPEALVTRRFV